MISFNLSFSPRRQVLLYPLFTDEEIDIVQSRAQNHRDSKRQSWFKSRSLVPETHQDQLEQALISLRKQILKYPGILINDLTDFMSRLLNYWWQPW